jgi:hypothetical protein
LDKNFSELTKDDIELIKDKMKTGNSLSLLMDFAALFIFIMMIICMYFIFIKKDNENIVPAIITFLIFIFLKLISSSSKKDSKELKKDISENKKEIFSAKIIDKEESGNEPPSYYFKIDNNEKLNVDITTFTRHDKGDNITIERAINSKQVLKIIKGYQ